MYKIFGLRFPIVPVPFKVYGSLHFHRLFSLCILLFVIFLCFLMGDGAGCTAVVSVVGFSAGFSVVVVVVSVVFLAIASVVVAIVVVLTAAAGGDDDSVVGSVVVAPLFEGFFLLVTWVHRSSVLFGWIPDSRVLPAFSLLLLVVSIDVTSCCLLRTASYEMSQLLVRPAVWPPSFDYHQRLLVFVSNDVRDGLKTLSIQTYVENIVSMWRPVSRLYGCDFCYAAILNEVRSEDILIKLYQDEAHGDSYSSLSSVFRL